MLYDHYELGDFMSDLKKISGSCAINCEFLLLRREYSKHGGILKLCHLLLKIYICEAHYGEIVQVLKYMYIRVCFPSGSFNR